MSNRPPITTGSASNEPAPTRPCIDFHFHSVYSNDAFGRPADYIAQVAQRGVVAIAPTEHDNTDSLAKYVAAAEALQAPVQIFSGVEIDTDSERWGHFHMLAFFFDVRHTGLQALLKREVDSGMQRLYAVAERMQQAGETIDLPAAFALYRRDVPDRAVGPKSLWQWLHHTGRTDSFDAAKELYGKFNAEIPAPVGNRPSDVQVVIDTVHAAGGITVLAHPSRDFTEADIVALFDLGLDGVEVFHMQKVELMRTWREVAVRHGWPMSGGSDYHDPAEPDQTPWPTHASADLLPGLFQAAKARHGHAPRPVYAPAAAAKG